MTKRKLYLPVAAILTLLALLWTGCSSLDALVLSLRTPGAARLRSYVLIVQDRAARKIIYHSGTQHIAAGRDLSADPLQIGLPFSAKGEFLVVVLAADYDSPELLPQPGVTTPSYFFARVLQVDSTQQVDALLLPVPPQYDTDGDHFPDAKLWRADFPDAAQQYGDKSELLDCLDSDPAAGDLLPVRLRSYDIHPLALSICDAKLRPPSEAPADVRPPFAAFDTTCGSAPRACIDQDGDGEPENTDCDDNDARRHHGNQRPRNCCQCTDRASCATNHAKLADLTLCQPPRCDTSFDYDCSGQDVDCFIDEDCDGYSPQDPLPSQRDCDDRDARIHPGAKKICDPENDADIGKDWACDGNPQGGCVDCDLDGDGYQRTDAVSGCPTKRYRDRYAGRPVVLDCNDDDRGMFPGSTVYQSPQQLIKDNTSDSKGGTVAAALRGLCRNTDLGGQLQDSNCDGLPTRGCPPASCDADGDGFPNGNAGCATDPKLIDCDDSDSTTFPGAPPYSKDSKDHNCDSKIDTCGVDGDGDGYCTLYDCNDGDPAVHPFAPESCNARDDDCDGLIDELNPDAKGNRMIETRTVNGTTYTMTTSCADSTVGDCGLRNGRGGLSGRCVCTAIKPNAVINAGSRVACPDGKDDESVAPKCFAATQPGLQTCDADAPHDEDCDGRTDAPDGKNLATQGAGTQCGVSVGRCHSGAILGCDRSKLSPFSNLVRPQSAQGPVPGFSERDRFLVCEPQSGVIYPTEEICNGYDDDCDGKLPGQDPLVPVPDAKAEIDLDGDTFLRCTGCSQVASAAAFNKAQFRACGDCNDTPQNGSRFYPPVDEISYPGAPELCDGLSNRCDPRFVPSSQDGVSQCGSGAAAGTPMCCQGPPQCIDPMTNYSNCGGCGRVCSSDSANLCAGGQCMCKGDLACDPTSPTKRYCQPDVGCVQCRLSNADCAGLADPTLRLCEVTGHRCVQCLTDADCMAIPGTVCDSKALRPTASDSHRCIDCASSADCKTPTQPLCLAAADPTKNVCTQCNGDADCKAFKQVVCLLNATDPGQNQCSGCRNNGDCKDAAQPACAVAADPKSSVCVACVASSDCKDAAKPACAVDADPKNNACVACVSSSDCKDAAKPACAVAADPKSNTCVACVANSDCKDAAKPACAVAADPKNSSCVACVANSDCKDAAKPACAVAMNPKNSSCVACLVDADCKDAAKPGCLVNILDATKNACVECTADAQCSMGKICDLVLHTCV